MTIEIEHIDEEQIGKFTQMGHDVTQAMRVVMRDHIIKWRDDVKAEGDEIAKLVIGAPCFIIAEFITASGIPDHVAHEMLQMAIDIEKKETNAHRMQ